MGFATRFLHSQLLVSIPYPKYDFSGQTVIVTGSNTGLGLEASRHIARLGASKVILACRNLVKGQAAADDIVNSLDISSDHVEVWELDLANYASIKAFAVRAEKLDRLDAVIQSAGILTSKFNVVEGMESHIVVNVISPVLLGLLILPKLRESARRYSTRGRLSFVGSDAQYLAKFKEAETSGSLLDVLNRKDVAANMGDRYNVSKLLLFFAIRAIVAKTPVSENSDVIVNCMTPGACRSDIFRDDKTFLQRAGLAVAMVLVARTTEVGSRTLVHAVKPDLEVESHGRFLMDCKIAENGDTVDSGRGQRIEKKFVPELFAKLESIQPGVTAIL